MEIQVAVAKINQFGSSESGDSVEVIERPKGGLSVIMCDALTSGIQAKAISGMVVRKVLTLLSDGVRDGSAARAASDFLFTERGGHDPAYLNILSADLETGTLVITRNNPTPIFLATADQVDCIASVPQPIGVARNIRPSITEITMNRGITVVMYTDGVMNAGTSEGGIGIDFCTFLEGVLDEQDPSAQMIADSILTQAILLDRNRPNDDMSVVVLRIVRKGPDSIRRMAVRLPVPQVQLLESDPDLD